MPFDLCAPGGFVFLVLLLFCHPADAPGSAPAPQNCRFSSPITIHGKGIHIERGHTRSEYIHGWGTHIEMGHKGDIHGAWSLDRHGKMTYMKRGRQEIHTDSHNTEEIKAGNSSVDY